MLDGTKHGQRLLMALTSAKSEPNPGLTASLSAGDGLLFTVCGLVSLMLVALLCVCGERKPKPTDHQNGGPDLNNVERNTREEVLDIQVRSSGEGNTTAVEQTDEGGPAGQTGHSRQASSSSGPSSGLRPTSLRELPEPPVSARHSRNTSMSGVELPAVPDTEPAGIDRRGDKYDSTNDEEYAYPKHVSPRAAKDTGKVKSHSDGYDHLGQNRKQERPINYDRIIPGKQEDNKTSPPSETGQAKGSDYSSAKDEDPYNRIGDSDGVVPQSFIRHLRESSDPADPYATVEDGSGGDYKSLSGKLGRDVYSTAKYQVSDSLSPHRESLNEYEEAEEEEEDEPEYAVVHKTRGDSQRLGQGVSGSGFRSSDELSTSSTLPPEPPRLYDAYEDEYELEPPNKPDHQYSRVTARESLASMSARKALNPYEMVPDGPENMYATVEGGSGDGVVIRHMDSDDNNSNRNSQNSDTYAEIGGVGASSSSSSATRPSPGSSNSNDTSRQEGASSNSAVAVSMNSSAGSEAPVPPSLDSLHQMTKSQTSNEGDRYLGPSSDLSGREASGSSRPLTWGNRCFGEGEEGSGGSLSEDGYSTLKRVGEDNCSSGWDSGGLFNSSRPPAHSPTRLEESRPRQGGQRAPDYSLVRDQDNDPNYESVDEARAKMRLLYKTDKSVEEMNEKSKTSLETSTRNNITVVKVLHPLKSVSTPTHSAASNGAYAVQKNSKAVASSRPARKPNHDYEEVDLSAPTSPASKQTSVALKSPTQAESLAEAKLKLARSHMYEEIQEVRRQSPNLAAKIQGNSVLPQPSSSLPSSSTSAEVQQLSSSTPREVQQPLSLSSPVRSEMSSGSSFAQQENSQDASSGERLVNSVGPDLVGASKERSPIQEQQGETDGDLATCDATDQVQTEKLETSGNSAIGTETTALSGTRV